MVRWYHLKTQPFEDRTSSYHSKAGLVWYSNAYCNLVQFGKQGWDLPIISSSNFQAKFLLKDVALCSGLHTWLPLWRTQVHTPTWIHIFSSFLRHSLIIARRRRLHLSTVGIWIPDLSRNQMAEVCFILEWCVFWIQNYSKTGQIDHHLAFFYLKTSKLVSPIPCGIWMLGIYQQKNTVLTTGL